MRITAPAGVLLMALALVGCEKHEAPAPVATPAAASPAASTPPTAAPTAEPKAEPQQWTSLFDGKTLEGWKVTEFGTQGPVEIVDGAIEVRFGDGLSGVSYTKPEALPKVNYEIELQAKRGDGVDFFCGLTFPYNDSAATLVCGGWGGALVGISSLDGQDAAHNDTQTTYSFEDGKWYTIRLRVTKDKFVAWIDKEKLVDVEIMGRKVSTRGDIELAAPLGLSTWNTTGYFRNIRIRPLSPAEISGK